MSLIVKRPDDQIELFCKGADSVIYDRLNSERRDIKEKVSVHLNQYAMIGEF